MLIEKRDTPQLMRVVLKQARNINICINKANVFCPHCGDCEDVLRNVDGRH